MSNQESEINNIDNWKIRKRKDLRNGHEGEYRKYYVGYKGNKEITKRLIVKGMTKKLIMEGKGKKIKRGKESKPDGVFLVERKDQRSNERRLYMILYEDGKEVKKHVYKKKETRVRKKSKELIKKKSKKTRKKSKKK